MTSRVKTSIKLNAKLFILIQANVLSLLKNNGSKTYSFITAGWIRLSTSQGCINTNWLLAN